MIFRTPVYYQDFQCIADRCQDNCCIGWEIDIDAETAEQYRSIAGEFGDRLRRNIRFGEPSCFILGREERCPFLNDRNLCDIITTLGEPALCQICTDHPRYYEWFGGVKEGGIGMCCEEAARIILSQERPFSVTETEIPDEDCAPYDEELYEVLVQLRENMFAVLHDGSLPLGKRLGAVLDLAFAQQVCTDNGGGLAEECPQLQPENGDMGAILQFLQTLEPISEAWHPTLAKAQKHLPEIAANLPAFLEENPRVPQYLRNIAVYFLWRYLLKGAFDGEFLSRAVLAVMSTCVIALLWAAEWQGGELPAEQCAEIAKNYSKEIEYSEENLNAVLDAAYDLPAMTVHCLKELTASC